MLKSEHIPTEVRAVFQKACDSGEPWNIADTIAAAINAWPGVHEAKSDRLNCQIIILPLPKEERDELVEKVVDAIRYAWDNASLEEAAKLCDYYAERHIDPMNFAKECAADIRALISKVTAQADAKGEK